MPEFAGGLLWLVFIFAGALVLNRSFAREMQNDCLDALVASPVPSAALFSGKALANFAILLAVECRLPARVRAPFQPLGGPRSLDLWQWSSCSEPGR